MTSLFNNERLNHNKEDTKATKLSYSGQTKHTILMKCN